MAITGLKADALYRACRLDSAIRTTDDLEPLTDILGQPRALEAIKLGIEVKGDGYNVFALGDPGIGKRSLIRQFLHQRAPHQPTPQDWCYVNNFEDADKPLAIALPPGRGRQLHEDMQQLLHDVRTVLPQAFDSDDYRKQIESFQRDAIAKHQKNLEALAEEAEKEGFSLTMTPSGVAFAAVRDGETLTPEQIEAMSDEERQELEAKAAVMQEKIMEVMQQAPELHREARKAIETFNREIARQVFQPLIEEYKRKYTDIPKVLAHLDAIRQHLLQHGFSLMRAGQPGAGTPEGDESAPMPIPYQFDNDEPPALRVYKANVIVSHDETVGAPVVYEENPTFDNLVGRIEYLSQMGTLLTDFNLIKPGALHRANGGYLILEAHRLISNPFAWDALKQALLAREIRIESPRAMMGFMTTKSLEPEPIPLDLKIILIGNRMLFYLLEAYDPDFPELVKIPADFADEMDRRTEDEPIYARLIATLVRRHELAPFARDAIERVIEQSSRLAGDSKKLSIHIRTLTGLLRESEYWASQDNRALVERRDVQKAIDAQIFRSDRAQTQLREAVIRGTLLIDTSGERIGQVNGLAVYAFGDKLFGHPSRITARTRLGEGAFVDIEREVKMGGPSHSKGVLIMQGFVTGRFARRQPFALSASLVFEQNYGGVDGDSASCAEVFALLSSIAEIPLKQCYAVTGSANQWGDVQAIGGVNEKIEGFFDVCRARGLDGNHGAIVPKSNVENLMLRHDIVEAVEQGKFHIFAIATIDEGLELLTGMTAGAPDAQGNYPDNTFNAAVAAKLAESARLRKEFVPIPEKTIVEKDTNE